MAMALKSSVCRAKFTPKPLVKIEFLVKLRHQLDMTIPPRQHCHLSAKFGILNLRKYGIFPVKLRHEFDPLLQFALYDSGLGSKSSPQKSDPQLLRHQLGAVVYEVNNLTEKFHLTKDF